MGRVTNEGDTRPEGYCVRERRRVPINAALQITMKNGRPAIKGRCSTPGCGANIFKIGKLPDALDRAPKSEPFEPFETEPLARDEYGPDAPAPPLEASRSRRRHTGIVFGFFFIAFTTVCTIAAFAFGPTWATAAFAAEDLFFVLLVLGFYRLPAA